jgi:hypothetical protein
MYEMSPLGNVVETWCPGSSLGAGHIDATVSTTKLPDFQNESEHHLSHIVYMASRGTWSPSCQPWSGHPLQPSSLTQSGASPA